MKNLRSKIIAAAWFFLFFWVLYYQLWGRHLYLVTAYCNCPICVNVPKYRDGQFASGRKVYWGAAAADPKIHFRTKIELVPMWPSDFWKISHILQDRRRFRVEDRGGKIHGRHIDLFIPEELGGHQTALQWGRQKMRIRLDGELAD